MDPKFYIFFIFLTVPLSIYWNIFFFFLQWDWLKEFLYNFNSDFEFLYSFIAWNDNENLQRNLEMIEKMNSRTIANVLK